MRATWTMAAAVLVGLILTGLIDAEWYTVPGGAFWLAGGTLLVLIGLLIAGRSDSQVKLYFGETLALAVAGVCLSVLFWFRARAGLQGGWLSGIELTMLAMFAWAWPALLLVVIYRRAGEGWRPASRSRLLRLTGVALIAGGLGWLLHFPLWESYSARLDDGVSMHQQSVDRMILRPTESPLAVRILAGPWRLESDPAGIVVRHRSDTPHDAIQLSISGRLLPGFRRNLSWKEQGTRVASSDQRVVEASVDDEGRWWLQPGLPGPALVTVSNGRARATLGVWVTDRHGRYPSFTVVTDRLTLESVSVVQPDEGFFMRQRLRLTNPSSDAVQGPIYALFRTDQTARVSIGSAARSRRIEPSGLPWVAAMDRRPGNPVPVLEPGQSVEFEVLVLPELTRDWLIYNVDLIQAFEPP
jgi:hypothetical protein